MNASAEIFEEHRAELLRLAYHLLGRFSVAQDLVQDAYLRWEGIDPNTIHNAGAYLSTIVTRLCLDELKSARNRREQYIGPNLPEPVLTSSASTPEENARLADSLSFAVLFLLEKLNPVHRAVFILREVFHYSYAEIAEIVNKSEAHCRKIAQRARDDIQQSREHIPADRSKHRELLKTFIDAVRREDLEQLESLLGREATLYSDGGGQVTAARKPIYGASNIARFMVGISKKATEAEEIITTFTTVNGEPGLLIDFGDQLQSVWTLRIEGDSIKEVFSVLNPDKLRHLRE